MRKTHSLQPRGISARDIPYLAFVFALIIGLFPNQITGEPKSVIHANGTYDLDQDGLSELLLVVRQPKGGTRIEYVEIGKSQNHQLLWSYEPPVDRRGVFTDVKIVNLDDRGYPEMIGILESSHNGSDFSKPWLYIFNWSGDTFTQQPLVIADERLEGQFIRPINLSVMGQDTEGDTRLAVALGSPLREVLILDVNFNARPWKLSGEYHLKPELFKNGFGRVYAATFINEERELLAVFSPEGSSLKTSVYEMSPEPREIHSDILSANGAHFLQAPDIMVNDFDLDGNQEVILPFQNGDLMLFSIRNGELNLELTDMSGLDLFILPNPASENDINSMVINRVEHGLYSTLRSEPVGIASFQYEEEKPDELIFPENIQVVDSIVVGDTFTRSIFTAEQTDFYSFQWQQTPPAGTDFDAKGGFITWSPTADQVGANIFDYRIEVRIGEKVLMVDEDSGPRHQIVPVLTEKLVEFGVLVTDSVQLAEVGEEGLEPVKEQMMLYSVAALIPDDKGDNRFVFESMPPFGLTTAEFGYEETNASLMHSISADVTNLSVERQIGFSYSSSAEGQEPVTTFKIIHDIETNMMTLSFTPEIEPVLQSLNPAEELFSELYLFPEYYFSGFPDGVGIDVLGDKLQFTIDDDSLSGDVQLSFVGITSPVNPAHLLTMYFNQGTLENIRGDVKVMPSGEKKVITEFEFSGEFNPVRISTQIRDSQLLSADSPFAARKILAAEEIVETRNFAMDFKPGDYVKIYDDPAYDFSGGIMTVEGSVYLTRENSSEVLLSKAGEFGLRFDESGRLQFWTGRTGQDDAVLTSANKLQLEQWVHFACIQDSEGMYIYENGVLAAENSLPGAIPDTDSHLFLGGWDFFSGRLDDLHLAKANLHTDSFDPTGGVQAIPETVSLWQFNQGRGLRVKDSSASENNGECYGAQWILNEPATGDLP